MANAVVLAVIHPTSVTLRSENFLAKLLSVCNGREIADTYAVERAFEFTRIFNFGNVCLDALVGELAHDIVCGFLGGLDAHLDDERAGGFLFDARNRCSRFCRSGLFFTKRLDRNEGRFFLGWFRCGFLYRSSLFDGWLYFGLRSQLFFLATSGVK